MRAVKLSRLAPPVPADGYQGAGIADATMIRLLPLVNVAVVVWAWFTVSPLGLSGSGLYGLVLMILGSMALSLRLFSPSAMSFRVGFATTLAGGVVAGLLFGFDSSSAASAFAPIIAGTAGFRFRPAPALTIAAVTSATAFVATAVRSDGVPYWALMVGLAVLVGMTRRDRSEALRLAREKVEQTDRAIASESRAQVLAERTRVAREIHDVLAHSLSGVNMQLNLADALLEDGRGDDGREAVRVAQTMVADGLVEARRAVYALRDESVELVPAIEAMAVPPTESVTVTGRVRPIDSTTVATLVRIVGEALTNARRHAPGVPVSVAVDFGSDRLVVTVADDGAPDAPVFVGGAGVGLTGMRERAHEIGATLHAGPRDGATGWTVRVEVSL